MWWPTNICSSVRMADLNSSLKTPVCPHHLIISGWLDFTFLHLKQWKKTILNHRRCLMLLVKTLLDLRVISNQIISLAWQVEMSFWCEQSAYILPPWQLDCTNLGRFFIKTDFEFNSCTTLTLQFNCKIQLSILCVHWLMNSEERLWLAKNECCSLWSHFRLWDLVRPETDSFCGFLFLFPLEIDFLGSYNTNPKLPRFNTKNTIKAG